jgi:hypothetical protein
MCRVILLGVSGLGGLETWEREDREGGDDGLYCYYYYYNNPVLSDGGVRVYLVK